MAINPAIAMSFQAPKFEDPMNRLVQMEQMKAYQQNALAKQMEMESAKEAMAQQKGLRNYLSGLSPNEMPSLGEMAQYGDKGLSMFNALSEAQEKQREAAANIYKEVYLPMLSGAKTAKDVYNWRQAVKSDPRVAPVVTKEADYGLPKTDEEVPAYLEQHFVPYSERYKQEQMNKRAQDKLDADANKPKTLPADVQEYEYAKTQGYKGTYEDWVDKNKKPAAQNPYDKKISELRATSDYERLQQAESAQGILNAINFNPETESDEISDLIKKSTGSSIERLTTDQIAKFGLTTEGRKAIAALDQFGTALTLDLSGGKLGAGISNTDREFMSRSLGDIANPNLPIEDRLAAWNQFLKRAQRIAKNPKALKAEDKPSPAGSPAAPSQAKPGASQPQAPEFLGFE
jgi:hypothetical protein